MNNNTFTGCMSDMEEHFNKSLKDYKFYWNDLKHLPDDAFKDICRMRIRGSAPNPGQFPTIQGLLDDWQMWLKNHPDREDKIVWEYCKFCEPDAPGLIRVKIPSIAPTYIKMGITHRHSMVRCGHCQNSRHRNPTWERYRVGEIKVKGWTVLTKEHEPDPEDRNIVPIAPIQASRSPGIQHISASLPIGDRDQEQEEVPF